MIWRTICWPNSTAVNIGVVDAGAGLGIERVPLTYRIPDLMVFRTEALPPGSRGDGRERPLHLDRPRVDRRMPFAIQSERLHSRNSWRITRSIAVPEVWLLDPSCLDSPPTATNPAR